MLIKRSALILDAINILSLKDGEGAFSQVKKTVPPAYSIFFLSSVMMGRDSLVKPAGSMIIFLLSNIPPSI
jgi:hypothetical protein